MDKKQKIITELVLSCFVNIIIEVSDIEWFHNHFMLRLLALIIFFIIVVEICFYVKEKLKHYISSLDYGTAAAIIQEIGEKYTIGKQNALFCLSAANDQIFLGENKYGIGRDKKKNNIVYYALSAKEYLNWIDYLYFSYIRKLKDKLKANIIIVLHVPDSIRLCKVDDLNADSNALDTKYQKIVDKFSDYIHKIIGDDIRIIKEEAFYNRDAKRLKDFHLVYDAFILHYASLLNISGEKSIDFEMFKRRLSHVKSAFPIWMIAMQCKRERLFVLDNALSMEIWKYEPLCRIREKCEMYFIEVGDIKYADGRRVNVHNKGNTINLTDDIDTIKNKIINMDLEIKQTIIQLIWDSENRLAAGISSADDEKFIDDCLCDVIIKAKEKYNF